MPLKRNFPYVTLLLGCIVLIINRLPPVAAWLQFDRSAILHGELWRIVTGHLTHWSSSHLFWDILVFLVLAGIIEWFSRKQLLVFIAAASFFISLLVLIGLPEMNYYRGLSGLDSGLFIVLLVMFYRMKASGRRFLQQLPYVVLGSFFFGKSVFELLTGRTLFVDPSELFLPVPLAHIGGIFIGLVISRPFSSQAENCRE